MIIAVQTLIYYRKSLLAALRDIFQPYYKRLSFSLVGLGAAHEDEDEDEVFADFDEEKGVVFFPPVYLQRYAAVSDCLMDERWAGKLQKVVDLGYHDMSFIKYLKDVPGINCIYGVDMETLPLRCSSDLINTDRDGTKRDGPLKIILFEGNAADPDYRLIGCDAVVAIEMIEHMLPHDLERLVHTVFGFIKPWVAIFTTPNSDFNVLFKNLGQNGFRRWDHYFEWSREQFHEWCSNILVRYPQFTVTCKGIGPGPPGTLHLGCCSQMAVFVNKEYQKQKDLDVHSLALVANSEQIPLADVMGWDSPLKNMENTISNSSVSTVSEIPDRLSGTTIVLTPTSTDSNFTIQDKTVQCNLDTETGKNFLMINEEDIYRVLVPRRVASNQVYEMEDVYNRLNSSTMQVKKFSKASQNLISKNRIEGLVHTRKVVDEIQHLTKMLNLNKDGKPVDESLPWCNINWGENAPYWNQYYKIVKQYNHPYEVKTDESRLLDALMEEISRQVDIQCSSEYSTDSTAIEIPIGQLMRVVKHLTNDVEVVKDLLNWNGYEVVDDVVLHPKLVIDGNTNVESEEDWEQLASDCDAEHSESSLTPRMSYNRCLRRCLENKINNFRSMMALDDNISVELDKVICRLMKLTMKNSTPTPPPSEWIQCKLFDLLTLAEKAVERRNARYIEKYIFCKGDNDLDKVPKYSACPDNDPKNIVKRYNYVIQADSNEVQYETLLDNIQLNALNEDVLVEKVTNYYDNPMEIKETEKIFEPEIIDAICEVTTINPWSCNKVHDRVSKGLFENKLKKTHSDENHIMNKFETKKPLSSLCKKGSNNHKNKVVQKKSVKHFARQHKDQIVSEFSSFSLAAKKSARCNKNKQVQPSTPIPDTYNEILVSQTVHEEVPPADQWNEQNKTMSTDNSISATKESVIIEIITEDRSDIVALRRTIGTDVDDETVEKELETYCLRRNDSYCNTFNLDDYNVNSETIFLNDIYEPSTSKGIRRVGMDVQCGPGPIYDHSMSRTNSLTRTADSLQFDNSLHPLICHNNSFNISTSTDSKNYNSKSNVPIGIVIKDSDTMLKMLDESSFLKTDLIQENSILTEDKIEMLPENKTMNVINPEEDKESENKRIVMNWEKCKIDKTSYKNAEVESVPSTKTVKSKLSCGAVHVHSYKNRQENEDVMVQGEWQRHSPSPSIRVKSQEKIITNRITESRLAKKSASSTLSEKRVQKPRKTLKREQLSPKRQSDQSEIQSKNENKADADTKKQNVPVSCNKNITRRTTGRKRSDNVVKSKRSFTQISSKLTVNSNLPKNKRKIYNPTPITEKSWNETYRFQRGRVPAYLKRIKKELDVQKNSIDESIGSARTVILQKTEFENNISSTTFNEESLSQIELSQLNEILKNKTETKDVIDKLVHDDYKITKDIKSTFLKYIEPNINYFIFRNEIETKSCSTECESDSKPKEEKRTANRIPSPCSLNSSTCSSPDSIATVVNNAARPVSAKVKKFNTSKKHSSFNKDSDAVKNKKYIKKIKLNNNFTNDKNVEDKENIPESSKISIFSKKIVDKIKFSVKDNGKTNITSQVQKSNIEKIANIKSNKNSSNESVTNVTLNNEENKNVISIASVSKIKTLEADSYKNIQNPAVSKPPLIAESQQAHMFPSDEVIQNELHENIIDLPSQVLKMTLQLHENPQETSKVDDCKSIVNWMNNSVNEQSHSNLDTNDWVTDVKNVNFNSVVGENLEKCAEKAYSKTQPGSVVSIETPKIDPLSSDFLLQEAYNCGLINSEYLNYGKQCPLNTRSSIRETDITSFKSLTSGVSEYAIATNEPILIEPGTSIQVCDIYERKELNEVGLSNPVGSLALQVFSGFSMNAESVSGDKADPVNLIDSETGSRAFDFRQATSEEVFVSGRSDDSFETCDMDEDIVVPEWLFNILNQQHDIAIPANDEEPDVPLAEPEFDLNGNVTAAPRVTAGAGDGRGVHSDLSQDSSGRGSSLTTTDSMSDPQNDTVELSPTSYDVTQVHSGIPLALPTILIDSPNVFNNTRIDSMATPDFNEGFNQSLLTSDGDADISSIDTNDGQDSELL